MDKKDSMSIQSLITEVELRASKELSDEEAFDLAIKLRKTKMKKLKEYISRPMV